MKEISKSTTPKKINAALQKSGINGAIVRNKLGGSYYYFIGDLFDIVPTINSYNLKGFSTEDVLNYINTAIEKNKTKYL